MSYKNTYTFLLQVTAILIFVFLIGYYVDYSPAEANTLNHPDDIYWDAGFGPPSFATPGIKVNEIVAYNGKIILGGQFFDDFNYQQMNNIMSWDGVSYQPLDTGLGFQVATMIVFENKLFVGGDLNFVPPAACWDGFSWRTLDSTLRGHFTDFEILNNELYACGMFDDGDGNLVSYIAKWNDPNWEKIPGTANGLINCMIEFNGQLIVAGSFSSIDTSASLSIAAWDGVKWTSFNDPFLFNISHLTKLGDVLIAGGDFGLDVHVATWTSSFGWATLPATGLINIVNDLSVYNNKITVSSSYQNPLTPGSAITFWDDTVWVSLGVDLFGNAVSMCSYNNDLYAAGFLAKHGQPNPMVMARYDQNEWLIESERGLNNSAYEMELHGDKLIVAFNGDYAGSQQVNSFCAFDGNRWRSIGGSDAFNMPALHSYNDSLYVGGNFSNFNGFNSYSAAVWDSQIWGDIGFTTQAAPNDFIHYNGKLIAVGASLGIYQNEHFYIAGRENDTWVPFEEQPDAKVNNAEIYKGELIISGNFEKIGTADIKHLAAWDGINWRPLIDSFVNTFLTPDIYNMRVINDTLYIAGFFGDINGMPATTIAFWDGLNWGTWLDGNIVDYENNEYILDVVKYNDQIIVSGQFNSIGGVAANSIAAWDGTGFSPLGSGLEESYGNHQLFGNRGFKLEVFNNELYVAGVFASAGRKLSTHIARWTKSTPTDIGDVDDLKIIPDEFILHQNYPNPFNPKTKISFDLTRGGDVTLEIFNILGQKVETLVDGYRSVGSYSVDWDATGYASGVYTYQLTVGDFKTQRKMVLVK